MTTGQSLRTLRLDWRRTVTENGFRKAAELTDYLRAAGFKGAGRYQVRAGSESVDLLAFQMHLLGYSVEQTSPEVLVVR